MNLKVLKFFVVAAFLAFAACAFLFSSSKIKAQSSENSKKRDGILEKVAAYKVWKQVRKPEIKSEDSAKTDTISISDSTNMG